MRNLENRSVDKHNKEVSLLWELPVSFKPSWFSVLKGYREKRI